MKNRGKYMELNKNLKKFISYSESIEGKEMLSTNLREGNKNFLMERKEFKEKLPLLIKHWKQEGKKVLEEDYLEFWDKMIPLYLERCGEEGLKDSLDIINIINENEKEYLNIAKEEFIKLERKSVILCRIVCLIVCNSSSKGEELANFLPHWMYSPSSCSISIYLNKELLIQK